MLSYQRICLQVFRALQKHFKQASLSFLSCRVHQGYTYLFAHATFGATACLREPPRPGFDNIHEQQYCSTMHGCLHLFRVRTPETTFVDMTLGCARMWVLIRNFTPDATPLDKMPGEITSGRTNASFGQ